MNINNFGPLNSEVWGTVSEWLMFIVTAASGFLIWQTLKSQNNLKFIEIERFKRENMPVWRIATVRNLNIPDKNKAMDALIRCVVEVSNGQAYNIKITCKYNDFLCYSNFPIEIGFLNTMQNENIVFTMNNYVYKDGTNTVADAYFSIEYSDQYGNKYVQLLEMHLREDGFIYAPTFQPTPLNAI